MTDPRPGRPRATGGGLRRSRSVPYTPEEWEAVCRAAAKRGERPSEYVRRVSLRAAARAGAQ